ncbi:MAG: spore cortex biosynthesis protein YabQ [Bacillota bacterium]|jgi:spore cortex biosynthesis protein YabQ
MDFLIAQCFNFLSAIGIGLLIGVLFDFYRGLGRKCRPSPKTIPLWDIFWWLLVTVLVFYILLNLNWGELRLYLFLGQIIGFVFYYKKISPYFLRNFIAFLNFLEKAIKKLVIIIVIPLRVIKNAILWPFIFIYLGIKRIVHYYKKTVWVSGLIFRAVPRKLKKVLKGIIKKIFLKSSRIKK